MRHYVDAPLYRPKRSGAEVRLHPGAAVAVLAATQLVVMGAVTVAGWGSSSTSDPPRMEAVGAPLILRTAESGLANVAFAVQNGRGQFISLAAFVGSAAAWGGPAAPKFHLHITQNPFTTARDMKASERVPIAFVLPAADAAQGNLSVNVHGHLIPIQVLRTFPDASAAVAIGTFDGRNSSWFTSRLEWLNSPPAQTKDLGIVAVRRNPSVVGEGGFDIVRGAIIEGQTGGQLSANLARTELGTPVIAGGYFVVGFVLSSSPTVSHFLSASLVGALLIDTFKYPPTAGHALLGVRTHTLETPDHADGGAAIDSVIPGSAAVGAGLEPGEVIVGLDDTTIRSSKQLTQLVRLETPGSRHNLTVVSKSGARRTLTAILGTE